MLPIYQTRVAQPALSGWLQRLLLPVLEACRFQRPPPLEIRPTGRWGGWCSDLESAHNGRVVLSSNICFWTSENIVYVYLHEASHRLLSWSEVASHGPEFLCLNTILLILAGQYFSDDSLEKLKLYDWTDCPSELEDEPGWRGQVLNFALSVAEELAPTDLAAESLPTVVCERWHGWLEQRQHDLNQQASLCRKAAQFDSLRLQLAALKNDKCLWVWIARIALIFWILLVVFLLTERWL